MARKKADVLAKEEQKEQQESLQQKKAMSRQAKQAKKEDVKGEKTEEKKSKKVEETKSEETEDMKGKKTEGEPKKKKAPAAKPKPAPKAKAEGGENEVGVDGGEAKTGPTTYKKKVKRVEKEGPERTRDSRGRFTKGCEGGPGRKKGDVSLLIRMSRTDLLEVWPVIKQAALNGDREAWNIIVRCGMPKTKGYVADPDSVSDLTKQILARFKSGELTTKDAAIEFDMNGIPLPEGFRTILSKGEIETEDQDADVFSTVSDEEMERRAQAAREAEDNEEWLEQRKEEMNELHQQVGDSYAPGATPSGKTEGVEGETGQEDQEEV